MTIFASLVKKSTDLELRSRFMFETYAKLYDECCRLDAGGDELKDEWKVVADKEGMDEDDEDEYLSPENLAALRAMQWDDLCDRTPLWDGVDKRFKPILEELKSIIRRQNPLASLDERGPHELCEEWREAVSVMCGA